MSILAWIVLGLLAGFIGSKIGAYNDGIAALAGRRGFWLPHTPPMLVRVACETGSVTPTAAARGPPAWP